MPRSVSRTPISRSSAAGASGRRTAARFSAGLLIATLALAGCKSDADRAGDYLRSAQELIAAGDTERALIELRNVFRYDGNNREARQTYADILLQRGTLGEAYSQYLLLAEQNPQDLDLRLKLANMALTSGNGEEFRTQTLAAEQLSDRDPRVRALRLALDYGEAQRLHDADTMARTANSAEVLLATSPDLEAARRIVIDHILRGDSPDRALPFIEQALETDPNSYQYNTTRFALLAQGTRTADATAQLQKLYELFPQNPQVQSTLISWYLKQGDPDTAERYVRDIAAKPQTDRAGEPVPTAGPLLVVDFLGRTRGPDAALVELDHLIAETTDPAARGIYQASRATIFFGRGERDPAIADLEAALQDQPAGESRNRMKTTLARMLLLDGNVVGARAQVEEVLAEDASEVDALKLRARMRIAEDKPSEAITDLRTALDQDPEDAEILTLMANAHLREGRKDLAGERLSLAVDVSGSAPAESLRYAQFLLQDGRASSAQAVLVQSAGRNPGNVPVMSLLADLYLGQRNWQQAGQLLEQLRGIDNDEARTVAQRLQAALLLGQNRTDEGIDVLQTLVGTGSNATAVATVVQTQIRANRIDEARSYLDGILAERPDDPALRLLDASLNAMMGRNEAAEATLRALIAQVPEADGPPRVLYGLLQSEGRGTEATEVLKAAIAAQPNSAQLQWIQAGDLERIGDYEGAIAIYEAIYARSTDNMVIANNLASMLSTYRNDPESLKRAEAIAQRLRSTTQPAFQDTYGWILFRTGQPQEALAYLEPAAQGLPNDPVTQFHLGMLYDALGRRDEAERQLRRALEIAGDAPLPQMVEARAVLARLADPTAAGTPSGATPGAASSTGGATVPATGQGG